MFDRLRPLVRNAMRYYVTRTAGPIEVDQKFVPKQVAKYVPPVPKKDCAANDGGFRKAYSTDSDNNNGGGVWGEIRLAGGQTL